MDTKKKKMDVLFKSINTISKGKVVCPAKKTSDGKWVSDGTVKAIGVNEITFKDGENVEECSAWRSLAPSVGRASIINLLLPDYLEETDAIFCEQWRMCYTNVLDLLAENDEEKVAFPMMFVEGCPWPRAKYIEQAIKAVSEWMDNHDTSLKVTFCVETIEDFNACKMFYPLCDWTDQDLFEKEVMDTMEAILLFPENDTVENALKCVAVMLKNAQNLGDKMALQVFRHTEYLIRACDEKDYEALRKICLMVNEVLDSKVADHEETEEEQELRIEPLPIKVLRAVFESKEKYLTAQRVELLLNVDENKVLKILRKLAKMNYIKIGYYDEKDIVFYVTIPQETFYLIHGQ